MTLASHMALDFRLTWRPEPRACRIGPQLATRRRARGGLGRIRGNLSADSLPCAAATAEAGCDIQLAVASAWPRWCLLRQWTGRRLAGTADYSTEDRSTSGRFRFEPVLPVRAWKENLRRRRIPDRWAVGLHPLRSF